MALWEPIQRSNYSRNIVKNNMCRLRIFRFFIFLSLFFFHVAVVETWAKDAIIMFSREKKCFQNKIQCPSPIRISKIKWKLLFVEYKKKRINFEEEERKINQAQKRIIYMFLYWKKNWSVSSINNNIQANELKCVFLLLLFYFFSLSFSRA